MKRARALYGSSPFATAYLAGARAASNGRARSTCPYAGKRGWSGGWRRAWQRGYDSIVSEEGEE